MFNITPQITNAITEIARIGTISWVDAEKSLVRLDLGGGLVSDKIPLMQLATKSCAVWVKPEIGEQAMLISPSGVAGRGVAIRGIYYSARKEPAGSGENIAIIDFEKLSIKYDGTKLDISGEQVNINITASNVNLKATKVVVDSGNVELGKGATAGVVNTQCLCVMGGMHPEGSTKIKTLK